MLLESIDKQVWLVNCKLQIQQQKLLVGYGYIGFVTRTEQQLYNANGKNLLNVILPDDLLEQYGCSQFNFYLNCKQNLTRL